MVSKLVVNRAFRTVVLLSLAILLVGVWMLTNARQPARAADSSIQTAFVCTPASVGVFTDIIPGRVHVRCSNSYNDNGATIYYWAFSASDSAAASRYQSLFSTALVTGTNVTVYFIPGDTSGATWGCGISDCRRIWGATAP